jgi:rod shape-determining protein MreD
MSLLLAAIGATATALIELSAIPYLRLEDANPHLIFVLGAILAIVVGLEEGLVWAFVGGIALDVLAGRPLGSTAFALLVSIGGAWALSRALVRIRPLTPIIAVAIFGPVYSMIQLALIGALEGPVPIADPLRLLVPGAVLDVVLAALIGPLAVAIHDRRLEEERPAW